MQRSQWSAPVSSDTAARRAGGRRRYNAERKAHAVARRRLLLEKLPTVVDLPRGIVRKLARELGVAPSTICRDLRRVCRPLPDAEVQRYLDSFKAETARLLREELERERCALSLARNTNDVLE